MNTNDALDPDAQDFEPKRVQITAHISLEARRVLERAKRDTGTPLGRLIDESVLSYLAAYRTD